jgi:phage terminase large subunit-like protein
MFPSTFVYEPVLRGELATVALAVDPAISENKRADHTAIVVAGRRSRDGMLFLLEEWGGIGKTPRDIINKIFELQAKWQADRNGIEAVQYQAALIFLMKEEMARRKLFFHIEPIKQGPSDKKVTRIQGLLSPRYAAGFLRHLVPLRGIESNLADWPNGKKDYADAASMALTLMGETSGLAMEGAMDHLPAMPVLPPMPEVLTAAGNYFIKGSAARVRRASRYPIAEIARGG